MNAEEDWLQGLIDAVNDVVREATRKQERDDEIDQLEGPILGRALDEERGVEVTVQEDGTIATLVLTPALLSLTTAQMGHAIVETVALANRDAADQRTKRNAQLRRSRPRSAGIRIPPRKRL